MDRLAGWLWYEKEEWTFVRPQGTNLAFYPAYTPSSSKFHGIPKKELGKIFFDRIKYFKTHSKVWVGHSEEFY